MWIPYWLSSTLRTFQQTVGVSPFSMKWLHSLIYLDEGMVISNTTAINNHHVLSVMTPRGRCIILKNLKCERYCQFHQPFGTSHSAKTLEHIMSYILHCTWIPVSENCGGKVVSFNCSAFHFLDSSKVWLCHEQQNRTIQKDWSAGLA